VAASAAVPVALVTVAVLTLSACIPIPVRNTQVVTPSVRGVLTLSDGTPAIGAAVALTASWKDTLCAKPTVRAITDSAGHFRVPAGEIDRHIFWLTLMENPGGWMGYYLCAGRTDSTGTPVYRARTELAGTIQGDSLSCLTFVWNNERVACNTYRGGSDIITGGRWTAAGETGTFRVLGVQVGRSYGERVVVQWVAPVADGRTAVRATVDLPTGANVAAVDKPVERNGRWYLRALSVKRTKWNRDRWLLFALGAPGEVRELSGW